MSRGFSNLTPEQRRAIASKGGKAAQATGRAHRFAPGDEARVAGAKGGRAVSADAEHMSRIGKMGGAKRREAAQKRREANEEKAAE